LDARVQNGSTVGIVVAAIYASTGEVDADIALLDREEIPRHNAPRGGLRISTQDGDVVPLRVEVPREYAPDLAGSTRDYDTHDQLITALLNTFKR
jgi:hypothetical protein